MSETVPNVPPVQIVIDVPLEGEPIVVNNGGLADYLIEAVLNRCAMQHSTAWEFIPAEGDPE